MKTYRIKSVFKTLQGEGRFAGKPALFIRFVGCNLWSGEDRTRESDAIKNQVTCPLFCDTDFRAEGSTAQTLEQLLQNVLEISEGIKFCVITGGEPLLQADARLMRALHKHGFFIAVETNGTKSIEEAFTDDEGYSPPDWIVCSPKTKNPTIEYLDELKVIVPRYSPLDFLPLLSRIRTQSDGSSYLWAQPEDGPAAQETSAWAVQFCLSHPDWRVSVQTHKILGID